MFHRRDWMRCSRGSASGSEARRAEELVFCDGRPTKRLLEAAHVSLESRSRRPSGDRRFPQPFSTVKPLGRTRGLGRHNGSPQELRSLHLEPLLLKGIDPERPTSRQGSPFGGLTCAMRSYALPVKRSTALCAPTGSAKGSSRPHDNGVSNSNTRTVRKSQTARCVFDRAMRSANSTGDGHL